MKKEKTINKKKNFFLLKKIQRSFYNLVTCFFARRNNYDVVTISRSTVSSFKLTTQLKSKSIKIKNKSIRKLLNYAPNPKQENNQYIKTESNSIQQQHTLTPEPDNNQIQNKPIYPNAVPKAPEPSTTMVFLSTGVST
jgi:hypothetical protein